MFKAKILTFVAVSFFGFLGQTSGGNASSDPWVQVLQWGPAGVVLLLLASGQLRFNREVKKAEDLYDLERTARIKAEGERDSVNLKVAGDFVPLLTEATHLLADFKPKTADRAVATALAAIADKLDEIDRNK